MKLKCLQLEQFRNYGELNLDCAGSNVIALIGPNAQGKTNLIEAIGFLAWGKSFQSRKSLDALRWGAAHGRVKAQFERAGRPHELEVFLQAAPEQRILRHNQQSVSPADFVGQLQVVLFTPDDLQMISGSPRLRRQYLDRLLVQLSPSYTRALGQYTRALKQRNALLKAIRARQSQSWELELWDIKLVAEADTLWKARRKFLSFLEQDLKTRYLELSGQNGELSLHYAPPTEDFDAQLIASRDADLRYGSTGHGPHRDDFELQLNGRPLAEVGSRGETRTAVLALKLGELDYLEQESGQKPILLLDDVFSELDEARQAHLSQFLEQGYQAVLSTTSMEHVKALNGATILEVVEGEVG